MTLSDIKDLLAAGFTHDEIMQLADTIGIIYNGKMLKIAEASSMTSLDVGKYMMGVKEA